MRYQRWSCKKPVLRIHDILVWIRIRGSMPLTNGSGSRSWIRILLFSSLTFKMPTKNYFFKFSADYFLKVHLHYFSKTKSQKDSQNSRNQGFSYYFCMMIEDTDPEPDPYLWLMDPDPGGPKTCGSVWIRIRNTAKNLQKRTSYSWQKYYLKCLFRQAKDDILHYFFKVHHCTRINVNILTWHSFIFLFIFFKKALKNILSSNEISREPDPHQKFRRACHALSLCTGGLLLAPSGLGGARCGLGKAKMAVPLVSFSQIRGPIKEKVERLISAGSPL